MSSLNGASSFFSSRRRHTRYWRDCSSDVCSSDLVLNKVDVPDARELVDLVREPLEQRGLQVFPVSAATGEGLRELGFALARAVEEYRAALPEPEPVRVTLTPRAVDDSGFAVERDPEDAGTFLVRGTKPERWV